MRLLLVLYPLLASVRAVVDPEPTNTPAEGPLDVRNNYIVKFKSQAAADNAAKFIGEQGGKDKTSKVKNRFDKGLPNGLAAVITPAAFVQLHQKFAGDIEYHEQEQVYQAAALLDPAGSWGLTRVSTLGAYVNTTQYYYPSTAGEGVDVYVVDTGIQTGHTLFGGRASNPWSAYRTGDDGNGHGTHCAGTVGAVTYGVANKVRLLGVKVLNDNGSGTTSSVVAGIDYVAGRTSSRPRVLSMSLGGGFSSSINTAVRNAFNRGVVVVVAAGNDNLDACGSSPASAPEAITVGASNVTDTRATFSNYGPCVDIFAPGVKIKSLTKCPTCRKGFQNNYAGLKSGTSMATPHVAGVAALLIRAEGLTNPTQVINRIKALANKDAMSLSQANTNKDMAYNNAGPTTP